MAESNSIAINAPARLPMRLLTDERLARLAAAGDERAFEQIFDRHQNELYRYCRGILSQHEDAQDALQATMAAALRSLPGEEREVKLRPWLYRVAHNEAITILRRRKTAEPGTVVAEFSPSAAAEAESRERLQQLVVDLDALPERQRGALTMRELSGMSYEEVGAALQLSPAAARQAVYEARNSLQLLEEGREMECEQARRAISAGDGRVLRGRKLRAHIRGCDGCQGFEASIAQRRQDFKLLSPALPGVAGAGLLATLVGGEAARAVATSTAVKALATIGAAAAIGTGAAGFSGAIYVPGFGGASQPSNGSQPSGRAAESVAGSGHDAARGAVGTSAGAGSKANRGAAANPHRSKAAKKSSHEGKSAANSHGANAGGNGAGSNAGGNSAANSAGSNARGNSASNSHGANAGGNSAVNSAGSSAGGSANSHGANAGGNSVSNSAGSNPGASANSHGANAGGKSATNSAGANAGGSSNSHPASVGGNGKGSK